MINKVIHGICVKLFKQDERLFNPGLYQPNIKKHFVAAYCVKKDFYIHNTDPSRTAMLQITQEVFFFHMYQH